MKGEGGDVHVTVGNRRNGTGDNNSYSDVAKFLFLDLSFLQGSSRKSLNPWCTLLGNKSTENFFCNRKLVQEILHANVCHIVIQCNAGLWTLTKEDIITGFGRVWFNEGGITSVLSFRKVNKKHDVRYYYDGEIFTILKPTHEVILNPIVGGLYCHDAQK